MFVSTKVFDGFSCCFRQWKATTTHCQYLHGYGVSFKVWFEGDLDEILKITSKIDLSDIENVDLELLKK